MRFDVDNIPEQYTVEVENRFQVLLREDDEEVSPNELWEKMKETVLSTAKKTIPKKKKKKQPWISKTTLEIADKRQDARKRGDMEEWRKQHNEVSKAVRADQRAFVERKCEEMEKAGSDSKKVYELVRELTQKSSARSDAINDRNGVTLTESADIKTRWAEYCTELYEQKIHGESTTNDPDELEFEPPPLLDEVRQAINEIRKGKSPGYDDIPGELWKSSGKEGINIMWRLCDKIWRKVEWPKD